MAGLREEFKSGTSKPPLQDMIDRMLFAEALETQKCFDEGVIKHHRRRQHRLDHGHRLPAVDRWRRQFITGIPGGKANFVAAPELAAKYGDRFKPAGLLLSEHGAAQTPRQHGRFGAHVGEDARPAV